MLTAAMLYNMMFTHIPLYLYLQSYRHAIRYDNSKRRNGMHNNGINTWSMATQEMTILQKFYKNVQTETTIHTLSAFPK